MATESLIVFITESIVYYFTIEPLRSIHSITTKPKRRTL